eukprot:GCRY01000074.1.p1 GENE.GCRY01000074.1~~GCRY01000074.1.p1  ORF type:complete len:540 (+),score=128.67 GCRY01000074.1:55-1674(+)
MKWFTLFAFICAVLSTAQSCTNFLVTKGASSTGDNMISYSADSHTLYGELYHYPAGKHPNGTMRQIWDWDSGNFLGQIPEAAETYNVVGNMNEFGLVIGETTYGGREELCSQKGAIIDYGSLIWITLQRTKTARDAIKMFGDLVATYGYASEGESFSIADPEEVWILELIGKGNGEKGAVWVAVRIPDGYIAGHANQARIRQFPLNDPENCYYAKDVIDFARKKGYYSGRDEDFSFSDTYAPLTPENARTCEGRVWSFFRRHTTGMDKYLTYVQGKDLTNRMPLYVKPTTKLGLNETMNAMRDHYEGTWFEMREDIGAGAFHVPYRWRPLEYEVDNKKYLQERATAQQQTGWTFVGQTRAGFPRGLGGILWFGVDDADSTVYMPMYCGMTQVPPTHTSKNADIMHFSFQSAFWVFNMVSNFGYTRYDLLHPVIAEKAAMYEHKFMSEIPSVDAKAKSLAQSSSLDDAIAYVTSYSVSTGEVTVYQWLTFWQELFVKYSDGNVKVPVAGQKFPNIEWPGYGQPWYNRIVKETGDHYLIPK